MTFYQELQLNQVGSKAVIRGAKTPPSSPRLSKGSAPSPSRL